VEEGEGVGESVGEAVGEAVGDAVGELVGDGEGLAAGDVCPSPTHTSNPEPTIATIAIAPTAIVSFRWSIQVLLILVRLRASPALMRSITIASPSVEFESG
jgi:hypothetical protein